MARIEHWYKNAVFYALDVEGFIDSNGDGVGDFPGLTDRLDYLDSLGVNCLWLLPFFPTPNRDNGYDISDFYGVDPRLGTLGDFAEFLREAKSRGIRVLLDLVVQHTSDQHPWFQAARRAPDSPYRDFYIWRDQPPAKEQREQIVYGRKESSRKPWTYDDQAGAYYLHHFYDSEPDLNLRNEAVRKEVDRIMAFWLQIGIDGFRVDAAPYLGAQAAPVARSGSPAHPILRGMRDILSAHRGNGVLVGEVDAEPQRLADYFGDGHELHMLFNFYLNNFLFLALATCRAEPIARAINDLPEIPDTGQWMNWVRNYDELDLERLSDQEREEVYRVFAPDTSMRIYERGIRRRLPPMVQGDPRRMRLTYSLVFSLPGSPCLFMGEEIGMGDDLSLPGRESVRTPMQWANQPNGGFSLADSEQLVRPVISDGRFGYPRVNVLDQRPRGDSFLSWMHRLIWIRRESSEIGSGRLELLPCDQPSVLVQRYRWEERSMLLLHNLDDQQLDARVDLGDDRDARLLEIFSDQPYQASDPPHDRFALGPFGFRWFRFQDIRR